MDPGDENGLITRIELRDTLRQLRADIEAEFQKLRAEVDTLTEHQAQQHGGESCKDSGEVVEGSRANDTTADVGKIQATSDMSIRSASYMEVRKSILRPKAKYAWYSTLWDASVFVGVETIGHGASALIGFLLASAIVIQSVYLFIIEDLLVQNPVSATAVADTLFWRYFIAHDIRYMEPHSDRSLATRVCTSDSSLEVSLKQQETHSAIQSFLSDHIITGSVVCILSIGSFLTVVIVEMRKSLALLISLGGVVSPCGTLVRMSGQGTQKLVLRSISRRRYVCVVLLTGIRVAIAFVLGWVAMRFLVYTTSVQTVILMSMKFAFIMNIDEILFAALTPSTVKELMTQLAPISAPYRLKVYAGVDLASILCIITFGAAMILASIESIAFQKELKTLKDAVCGGNTNFVFTTNPTNGIIEWAATLADAGALSDMSRSYVVAAVSELRSMGKDAVSTLSINVDLERVSSLSTMSSGQYGTATFSGCKDRLDVYTDTRRDTRRIAQLVISSKVGYNVTSCQTVSDDQCDAYTEVRALCPVGCGCGDFNSGLFLNSVPAGCVSDCFNFPYRTRFNNSCADMTITELQSRPEWLRYWKGFENHFQVSEFVELSLQSGCSIIQIVKKDWRLDLCVPSAENIPGEAIPGHLTGFCPETCGCPRPFDPVVPFCPIGCADRDDPSLGPNQSKSLE